MRWLKYFRPVVLLGLTVIALHASLFWVRFVLIHTVEARYGQVSIDQQGRLRHWRRGSERGKIEFLSGDEVEPGATRSIDGSQWAQELDMSMAVDVLRSVGGRVPEPASGPSRIAVRLSALDGQRIWTREEGRFVARRRGRIVAALGADGLEYDPQTSNAQPLSKLILFPGLGMHGRPTLTLLALEAPGRRLLRLTLRLSELSAEELKPTAISVEWIPLDPPVEPFAIYESSVDPIECIAIVGSEYWVVGLDGEIRERQPLGLDYRQVIKRIQRGPKRGYLSGTGAIRPGRFDLRVYVAEPGREPIVRDVTVTPLTTDQKLMVAGFGVAACLRPFPLNVAATSVDAPANGFDLLLRWWLDPWFAGGANALWLLVALTATLLCTAWAWWQGRRRCGTRRQRVFWIAAALLLGPTGVIWMRLAIPWVAIEDGRAVNLESPEWPEPLPLGTEVFA